MIMILQFSKFTLRNIKSTLKYNYITTIIHLLEK